MSAAQTLLGSAGFSVHWGLQIQLGQTQVTGLNAGVAAGHSLACPIQQLRLDRLVVASGLTFYEHDGLGLHSPRSLVWKENE